MPDEEKVLGFFAKLNESELGQLTKFSSQVAGVGSLGLSIYKLFTDKQGEILDKINGLYNAIDELGEEIKNSIEKQTGLILTALSAEIRGLVLDMAGSSMGQIKLIADARRRGLPYDSYLSDAVGTTGTAVSYAKRNLSTEDPGSIPIIIQIGILRIAVLAAMDDEQRVSFSDELTWFRTTIQEAAERYTKRVEQSHGIRIGQETVSEPEFFFRRDYWAHTHHSREIEQIDYYIDRGPSRPPLRLMSQRAAKKTATEAMERGRRNEIEYLQIPSWRATADEWARLQFTWFGPPLRILRSILETFRLRLSGG
jgi:hypothetical protein